MQQADELHNRRKMDRGSRTVKKRGSLELKNVNPDPGGILFCLPLVQPPRGSLLHRRQGKYKTGTTGPEVGWACLALAESSVE